MPESSGGIVSLGMVAMFASMFPGMMPMVEWKGLDGQGTEKSSQKSMQEIYLDMIGIKDEAVQGRLPRVKGLIEPVIIRQEDLEKNPDVVQAIAKIQDTTTTTTMPTVEVWQGGGPLTEQDIDAVIGHTAGANEKPGNGCTGFAADEMPDKNTWERTLAATGNPETGFAA